MSLPVLVGNLQAELTSAPTGAFRVSFKLGATHTCVRFYACRTPTQTANNAKRASSQSLQWQKRASLHRLPRKLITQPSFLGKRWAKRRSKPSKRLRMECPRDNSLKQARSSEPSPFKDNERLRSPPSKLCSLSLKGGSFFRVTQFKAHTLGILWRRKEGRIGSVSEGLLFVRASQRVLATETQAKQPRGASSL